MILSILILSGCRTIKKSFSSADSSSVKTENNSSKYNRETITEYLIDTLWRTHIDTLYKTMKVPSYQVVEKPYIIRQTIRESGEQQTQKKEEVQVSEVEKEKDAKFPVILQYSALMAAAALLIIAIAVVIKQFK